MSRASRAIILSYLRLLIPKLFGKDWAIQRGGIYGRITLQSGLLNSRLETSENFSGIMKVGEHPTLSSNPCDNVSFNFSHCFWRPDCQSLSEHASCQSDNIFCCTWDGRSLSFTFQNAMFIIFKYQKAPCRYLKYTRHFTALGIFFCESCLVEVVTVFGSLFAEPSTLFG